MMKKMNTANGFSRLEVLCMISIASMVLFFVFSKGQWIVEQQHMGEDKLLMHNAENTAIVETATDSCPVYGCKGDENCTHRVGGFYVGYFNRPTNKIQGTPCRGYNESKEMPCKGYNESKEMEVNGKKYYGETGTMIIKVRAKDGTIELSWVKGLE